MDRDLRQLLESFPGVIWVTDAEFHGSEDPDLPQVVAHRRALQGEGTSYRQAFGGQIREGRVEPRRDGAGAIVGVVGMSIDMTDLEAAQAAVHHRDALVRAVVDFALDAVIIIGA